MRDPAKNFGEEDGRGAVVARKKHGLGVEKRGLAAEGNEVRAYMNSTGKIGEGREIRNSAVANSGRGHVNRSPRESTNRPTTQQEKAHQGEGVDSRIKGPPNRWPRETRTATGRAEEVRAQEEDLDREESLPRAPRHVEADEKSQGLCVVLRDPLSRLDWGSSYFVMGKRSSSSEK